MEEDLTTCISMCGGYGNNNNNNNNTLYSPSFKSIYNGLTC